MSLFMLAEFRHAARGLARAPTVAASGFLCVLGSFAVVAIVLAALVPAQRATRVDPVRALQAE